MSYTYYQSMTPRQLSQEVLGVIWSPSLPVRTVSTSILLCEFRLHPIAPLIYYRVSEGTQLNKRDGIVADMRMMISV